MAFFFFMKLLICAKLVSYNFFGLRGTDTDLAAYHGIILNPLNYHYSSEFSSKVLGFMALSNYWDEQFKLKNPSAFWKGALKTTKYI